MRGLTCALCLFALPGAALAQEAVSTGSGAILRVLDKRNGIVEDLRLPNGGAGSFGRVTITLKECRYPEGNPSGDAYAFVSVTETGQEDAIFNGWIIASSPAIHSMDHPRYDVWALRCTT